MPQPIKNTRILAFWLFFCAFMVMAMTGIGAVTRLTESGLSITEWKVISGTIPPIGETAWQAEFAKYQATPEFAAKHHWMTIDDFKGIYFWEWFHRLWGRLIGLAFGIPMIFFWAKGWIPKEDRLKYLGLLLLGGSQGALGWFMVKSGLVDRPSVSHFRLAAHLSTALIIYSALIWMGLRNWPVSISPLSTSIKSHGVFSLALTALTIIWGAFVAGLDAGMIYNSFPLMGRGFIPPEWGHTPFLTDPASIQFIHRCLAILTGCAVITYGLRWIRHDRIIGIALTTWVFIQIGLGIITLLTVVWIPVAVMHQMGAVILLTIILLSLYKAMPSRANISV